MSNIEQKTRETLITYLDDYLKRGEETVFVSRRGLRFVRWSYGQLVLTARRVARDLDSRGIAKGERVLLIGENSPEWVAAFWGCVLHGVVVVPLDENVTDDFALAVQRQTEPKLVFASRSASTAERLNVPVILLEQLEETVAAHASEPHADDTLDQDTLVEIIFTSGTTSTPKGVLLTHRNLLANLLPFEAEIAKYLKWERFFHPVRFLNLVPLSHVFGQFMGIFVPQLIGGEVHFHDSVKPAEIVRRTRESRISVIVTVPRILDSLRAWVERNSNTDLRQKISRARQVSFGRRWWMFRDIHRMFGWKFWAFVSGGATLEERTDVFWRRLGFAVLQGYGMTETASLITVTHPFKRTEGSVGKLMPGYEVRLGETGEIIVRGQSVSPGYWIGAEAGKNPDDWLYTGDVGEIDEHGNLFFKGRQRDVIVTPAGLNVYPEDLEEALNSQPEVRESCVIEWTKGGTKAGEPLAVVIPRVANDDVAAAIARANEHLANYQQIRHWQVWPDADFPRTATQKIIKRQVAAEVEQLICSSENVDDVSAASSFVLEEAIRLTGHNATPRDKPLNLTTDLKLDSLGRIELLSALEERYQIEIDEAAFTGATTVDDVERLVLGETRETVAPYPYPKWSRRFPITWLRVFLFYTILLPITLVMSRMTVKDKEILRDEHGPVLFIANHVTLADHALILAALPFRLRHRLAIAMEGEHLRNWLHPLPGTSWPMRLRQLAQYVLVTAFFHVFPLPKQSGFRRAFAYAGECVDGGNSVLVFPEGIRAPRGQMHMSEFRAGIGLLAKELNIPVVPVKLNGLYELKRRQQYFAPPGMVSVVFGEPVKFDPQTEPAAIAEDLEGRINAL
ncbi:MAG TPA: AMP-binding protein [Pyrinomonadaceae bacterium]|nr:AMP-binding protein [Pyrinomonadaceae bacterium]